MAVKAGCAFHLPIRIRLPETLTVDDLSAVEFIFTQYDSPDAPPIKTEIYGDGGTVVYLDGHFYVPFSEADTRLFIPDKFFYADVRITLVDIADNPMTNGPLPVMMRHTLFREDPDD